MTKRLLLFAICIAGIAGYGWWAVCSYRAYVMASRPDLASIEKALVLAPRNAEYHERLCRSRMFSYKGPDNALRECQKAAELNPYSSSIWLDLAQAYYLTGNIPLNDAAIHKALSVDPSTPNTIWNVANFLLIQGNTSEALKQFAIVLQKDPSLLPASLNICWHTMHDVNRIQSMLPETPAAYLEFVRVLDAAGEYDQASRVWGALVRMNGDIDYHQFLFYIDDLIQAGRAGLANQAWRQLGEKSEQLHAFFQPGNLVMDGSFAQEILNSGFDWRYTPNAFVDVTLDSAESHRGARSLRLAYSAANGDAGVTQYIAVRPDSRYRLSAWVKSQDLETANGPTLTLSDASTHMPIGSTQDTVGTTAWHPIESELTTGPATELVILSVTRSPGETAIRGKFWVEEIRLELCDENETTSALNSEQNHLTAAPK